MAKSNRLKKKIAKLGSENVKHARKRWRELRLAYFELEQHRNELLSKEWAATKRALLAEKKLEKLMEANLCGSTALLAKQREPERV